MTNEQLAILLKSFQAAIVNAKHKAVDEAPEAVVETGTSMLGHQYRRVAMLDHFDYVIADIGSAIDTLTGGK